MSPSNRIRIALPAERYADLCELAAAADRTVSDEARTLLAWATRVMIRRANRIYGPGERAALHAGVPPGWAQLLLPEDPDAADRLELMWHELRAHLPDVAETEPESPKSTP